MNNDTLMRTPTPSPPRRFTHVKGVFTAGHLEKILVTYKVEIVN